MASGAISEYFEAQNGNGQACGRKFAAFLAREFPGLRPDLSFSLPMRRVGRKRNEGYAAFSAAKNHFSIRFSDADYAARPGAELPSCKAGKRCINIQYGDEQTSAAVQPKDLLLLGGQFAGAVRAAGGHGAVVHRRGTAHEGKEPIRGGGISNDRRQKKCGIKAPQENRENMT